MDKNEFEKLIKQVVRIYSDAQLPIDDFSKCLSNEVLEGICAGTLTGNQQEQAIQHLAKCKHCRTELEIYFELSEPNRSEGDLPDITVFVDGKKQTESTMHWLSKGKIFEIWNIKAPGKYIVRIGSKSVEFECQKEQIIKQTG
nr:hypothetical protein [Planctomycetota bacterium]